MFLTDVKTCDGSIPNFIVFETDFKLPLGRLKTDEKLETILYIFLKLFVEINI